MTWRRHPRLRERAHLWKVQGLMRAARDSELGPHLERSARLAGVLAHSLGLSAEQVRHIAAAAALHDIGKIGIADAILLKPAPLDDHEWAVMQRHTVIGAGLLAVKRSPLLELGREIALWHHECWDGSGYPLGLRGREIPLAARIVKLCDQYDALRSPRCYKPAYDHEIACGVLLQGDDRTRPEHFEPRILEVFREIHLQFEALWRAL